MRGKGRGKINLRGGRFIYVSGRNWLFFRSRVGKSQASSSEILWLIFWGFYLICFDCFGGGFYYI